jgi:hypothetical protein
VSKSAQARKLDLTGPFVISLDSLEVKVERGIQRLSAGLDRAREAAKAAREELALADTEPCSSSSK